MGEAGNGNGVWQEAAETRTASIRSENERPAHNRWQSVGRERYNQNEETQDERNNESATVSPIRGVTQAVAPGS